MNNSKLVNYLLGFTGEQITSFFLLYFILYLVSIVSIIFNRINGIVSFANNGLVYGFLVFVGTALVMAIPTIVPVAYISEKVISPRNDFKRLIKGVGLLAPERFDRDSIQEWWYQNESGFISALCQHEQELAKCAEKQRVLSSASGRPEITQEYIDVSSSVALHAEMVNKMVKFVKVMDQY